MENYTFFTIKADGNGVVRNAINNVAGSIRYTYNTNYINYRGTDNKIYWVNYNNGWQWGVLNNNVADVAGNITLSSNSNYLNYLATDGRIKFFGYSNGGWNDNGYLRYRYNKAVALYEVYSPGEAKRIWDRFEFIHTPKHGSWLNMAEIELNVLMGQCLNRRIDNMQTMKEEMEAWHTGRNNKEATINWQFTNQNARIKLKRLYPTIAC